MLQKARSWTGLTRASPKASGGEAEAAALGRFIELVPEATLDALVETHELPSHADSAVIEATLLRFLRAEKLDVDKALTRINAHAKWRREFLGSEGVQEAEIRSSLDSGKVFLQPPGAKGRPVLIIRARHHRPGDQAEVERFVCYCLEAAARLCDGAGGSGASPDGKLQAIFDFKGLELKNLDAGALRSCFSLLNLGYPERVLAIYMVDAPAIFWGLWKVVSPFVDPVSRGKIKFVNGAAARAEFLEALGADAVPEEYGGSAKAMPVEAAAAQTRAAQAALRAKADTNGTAVAITVAPADGAAAAAEVEPAPANGAAAAARPEPAQ